MSEVNDLLWTERYRPKTVEECILPDHLKKKFQGYVEDGNFPNLLLHGGAGVGKTTVARAMCRELGYDVLYINASIERSIDVMRNQITNFCSTVSFDGNKKAVILDEADGLTGDAQNASRALIEQFHTTKFFFTCNYLNNIKDPIKSRTTAVDFTLTKAQTPKVAARFIKRIFQILDGENVKYDADVVTKLVLRHFPDCRRVLNELQGHAKGTGEIDSGVLLESNAEADLNVLYNTLASKDFLKMRKWVANNAANADRDTLIRRVYDVGYTRVEPSSIPQFVVMLSEFSYKQSFITDGEIAWTGFFTELMGNVEVKSV